MTCGALVWCGAIPRCSGVKQKVTVTSKSASASICRSNQAKALGRKLSAQDSPVRKYLTPRRFIQSTVTARPVTSFAIVVEEEAPAESGATPRGQRPLGLLRGQFVVPDDFDAPLPPEIQRYFDGDADKT